MEWRTAVAGAAWMPEHIQRRSRSGSASCERGWQLQTPSQPEARAFDLRAVIHASWAPGTLNHARLSAACL
eukprot:12682265-Alexandrium_andersonii.AAC.1